ncbi:MAG: TRAP transporter small permease [Gemmatimonadetes bacterium]|nr:TRAP transporter small permease [Gemmatimonadota bacterium]MYE69700.1 TRAP transporter small permease [Gemmatimonadota bacterium]MYJ67357.1 TRAP transporter small permease [Gemmatimonadota bacterium]
MKAFRLKPGDRSRVRRALQRGLIAACAVAGGGALLLLVGLTVAEVVARHLFRAPLQGVEDVASMALTVLVAAAVVCAAQSQAHVSVDLIGRVVGGVFNRVTDVLARLVGAIASGVAAYALLARGGCGIECAEVTGTMGIVHTPFYYALGVGMAMCSLLLVYQLIRRRAAPDADERRGAGN